MEERSINLLFELYGRHPVLTNEWYSLVGDDTGPNRTKFLNSIVFKNPNNTSLKTKKCIEGGLYDIKNEDRQVRFCHSRNEYDLCLGFRGNWELVDQLDVMDAFKIKMEAVLTVYSKGIPDSHLCRARLLIE